MMQSKFQSSLKMGNMKAVSKKGAKSLKETYKPISILLLIATNLGRIVCQQLNNFFNNNISKYQYGFRKGLGRPNVGCR